MQPADQSGTATIELPRTSFVAGRVHTSVCALPVCPDIFVTLSKLFLCASFDGFDTFAKVRSHGPPVRISVDPAGHEQGIKCGEGPHSNTFQIDCYLY